MFGINTKAPAAELSLLEPIFRHSKKKTFRQGFEVHESPLQRMQTLRNAFPISFQMGAATSGDKTSPSTRECKAVMAGYPSIGHSRKGFVRRNVDSSHINPEFLFKTTSNIFEAFSVCKK